MKIDCIIVEDEPLAMERTKDFVSRLSFLQLVATAANATEALSVLQTHTVDLIFLDINIGDMSGIRLLETAKPSAEVIIITAYHEYALKGFELNVTDYLLKPFPFERFYCAVERVQANLLKKQQPGNRDFLFVKTEHRLVKIPFSGLLYIEGMRDYRRIHTVTHPVMTLQTFRDLERKLDPAIVCRVHKSYMVSLDKIESIEKDRIRIRNTLIPISETYKKAFFEIINSSPKS